MTASECETNNNNGEKGDDKNMEVEPPMPLDGGWGWMVVFASLLCNIIVDGVCFSFGIFYVEFLDYFGESKAKTAWVGSLVPGMYLGVGPIVSALANKYGCRTVTCIGSALAGVSFFISTFSPNINWLIVTYGIMGGISFGLMYLPSIVIVGYYFDKKRAFATGLAVCGSGIGTSIFAPLASYLLSMYGWKGANWIIAGIILHGIACGLIFRPLEQNRRPRKRHESDPKDPIDHGVIMNQIIKHKNRERQISTGTLNGALLTKDNQLISNKEQVERIMAQYEEQGGYKPPLLASTPDLCQRPILEEEDDHSHSKSNLELQGDLDPSRPKHKQLTRLLSTESKVRQRTISNGSDYDPSNHTDSHHSRESLRKREAARPLYRADIFYSGSVTHIPEYVANPDMHSYMGSVMSVPTLPDDEDPDSCKAKCLPLVTVLKSMLDFSLLKSPTFVLLCLASILAMTGFFTPFIFLTAYSLEQGVPLGKATLLITLLGIFNTIGRIISGWLSDRPWVDCILVHNLALIIAGVATCAIPLISQYYIICAYCCVFGSCIAAFIALRSIVLVDLLGVQKLSNAFGILLLFQGIAAVIGSPLAGALYDWSGSYAISFITSGGLIALAGLICLPVRYVSRWEAKRNNPDGFNEHMNVHTSKLGGSQYSRLSTKEVVLNNTVV